MKIGLIDVDGHHYPNLPLMKLSAWHKAQGDSVEWYEPMINEHLDIVYMSKVFSFTEDYPHPINADKIIKGGSGYAISLVNGKEIYDKSLYSSIRLRMRNKGGLSRPPILISENIKQV